MKTKMKTDRHYVGYDIDDGYVKLAERRIEGFSIKYNSPGLFDL